MGGADRPHTRLATDHRTIQTVNWRRGRDAMRTTQRDTSTCIIHRTIFTQVRDGRQSLSNCQKSPDLGVSCRLFDETGFPQV